MKKTNGKINASELESITFDKGSRRTKDCVGEVIYKGKKLGLYYWKNEEKYVFRNDIEIIGLEERLKELSKD